MVLSLLLRIITGPVLWSLLIVVVEDCLRRPANLLALFDNLLMMPGDLLSRIPRASLMAVWLDFLELKGGTMDSGSSNACGKTSISRPRGPSGDPCMEELLVVSWFVSGVMTGEV